MDKPKSPPPSPPHATTSATATANNSSQMENIKSLLVKCAIASSPAKKSLTPLQKAFIEKRIPEIFPNIHTPDHPTYAWMIESAIRQLNEEGGSSEEAISKFILQEYKDLPFAHGTLLKHHLRKLSESDDLLQNHNGCYSIGKPNILLNRTSKPNPTFTNTMSLIPVLSPSPSPSPDPSCSSSPAYESSSAYSSSESFTPKRKGRKKMKRKKIKRKKSQNAREIKIHTEHDSGRARARGRGGARGRGRGRGRGLDSDCSKPMDTLTMMEVYDDEVEDDEVCVNHSEAIEIQFLMVDDEVADENIGIRDSVEVESRALESVMVIATESLDHENRVGEERIEPLEQEMLVSGVNGLMANAIRSSRGKKVISEQGSKNVRPHKRSIHSMHMPQTGRRRGRHHKRDWQMEEYGKNNMANIRVGEIEQAERGEEDMLDELIEEVYMELKGVTEIQNPTTEKLDQSKADESERIEKRDHAEGMQCKLNHQSEIIDLESFEWEYHVDENLNDKHLEKDVCGGTLVVNEVIENQFQMQPGQNELAVVLNELRRQESNEIEERVGLKVGEMEIIGQIDMCEGDHRLIGEENHIKNTFDVFGEQKQHIERQSDEQRAVDVADHDQPIKESKRTRIETLKMEDNNSKEINDVEPLEQELKSTDDDPNELQLQECTFATPNGLIKQKLLEEDRVSWMEEQNHAQIHELEDETANDGQVQLKGGEIEIIGNIDTREGDRPLIEEDNHIKNTFEVLEEQNEHIKRPGLILEQNQCENPHCVLVDRERKNNEEIQHCDERRKLENGNGEDQDQHSEESTRLFSEQSVEKTDHHQPLEDNTSKEVKTMAKPQSRQLRPRPPKLKQDQTEGQFGLSTPEKSIETNQCRKLRPLPSKNESNDVANSAESFAARHALHRRRM